MKQAWFEQEQEKLLQLVEVRDRAVDQLKRNEQELLQELNNLEHEVKALTKRA